MVERAYKMNEMSAGGFSEELINEIHMMNEENKTSVDFAYSEKMGQEGKDDGITEEEYNKELEQQLQKCTNRKPVVRMKPRVSTRPSKKDKRRLIRAVESTDKLLTDKQIDRVISILGS